MAQHNLFGTQAEEKALEYLLQRGYQLLEKNYRYAHAEVDLLMRKKDKLICIEVKARSTAYFGSPEGFISTKKIQLLVRVVDHYLELKDWDPEVRFDVISILKKGKHWQIKHLKNAFYAWQ
ncbi:MAG: YraN family protein [Flavobacteriaceae bacterium]